MWTGGFSCPGENVALLACVAKAGYHSNCQYHGSGSGITALWMSAIRFFMQSSVAPISVWFSAKIGNLWSSSFLSKVLLPSNLYPLFTFIFDATVSA